MCHTPTKLQAEPTVDYVVGDIYAFVTFEQVMMSSFWLPKPTSLLSFYRNDDADSPAIQISILRCERYDANRGNGYSHHVFKDTSTGLWQNQINSTGIVRVGYEWPIFPQIVSHSNTEHVQFDLKIHLQRLSVLMHDRSLTTKQLQTLAMCRTSLLLEVQEKCPEYQFYLK